VKILETKYQQLIAYMWKHKVHQEVQQKLFCHYYNTICQWQQTTHVTVQSTIITVNMRNAH